MIFPFPTTISATNTDVPQLIRKAEELISPASVIGLSTLVGTNDRLYLRGDAGRVFVVGDWTNAGASPGSVLGPSPAQAVQDLRRLTQLPLATIAGMLGVERRSLYFWLEGRPIAPDNQTKLEDLRSLAFRLNTGTPSETSELLLASAETTVTRSERPDRLAGLRAIEGQPGAALPTGGVARLLERGDDRLRSKAGPPSPMER